MPIGLAVIAFVVAFAQRPGQIAADTKIDLHTDAVGFLGDVASVWSSSGGLGQVQAGQYAGYLFPMGPFFGLGDVLGLEPWLLHRLWLGTLLAMAAWGTVRLLDALLDRRRGVAHLVAGLAMILNPYVAVFTNRTSVTLLGFAALPWLLLATYRTLQEPRGYRGPAAFALVLACTGGGVNAAVTGWLLLGPALLVAFEVATRTITVRALARAVAVTTVMSVAASLWWLVPVVEHARYGLDFLPFTETVGAIWETTSLSESFRMLGYWISYLGTGYQGGLSPYFETSATFLFEPLVIVATFAVPGLAVLGFTQTARWRYAPYFLALVLLGLLVMSAGFPPGSPLRRVAIGVYNAAEPLQFLRTTYKAGPLVALGLACLLGAGAGAAWLRLGPRRAGPALAVLLVLMALASGPLVQGRAIDGGVAFDRVPQAWTQAASSVDHGREGTRALVLPGQLFSQYRWANTQDAILPALSRRPVSVRSAVPFSDLHAADLLVTTDGLLQQRRLMPGQLRPLLDLMGVGTVVTGTDDNTASSGSIEPGAAAALLDSKAGLGPAGRRLGPGRVFPPADADLGSSQRLPEVAVRRREGAPGLVRVQPLRGGTLIDGSAEGLAALASTGGLDPSRRLDYAGDLSPSGIRREAGRAGEVVITDSNRRRTFLSSRYRQNHGVVVPADEALPKDGVELNPFPERGSAGQTVAQLGGVRWIRSPFSPNFPQFPEHRAYAAFDGDPATYWVADRYLERERRFLEVRFTRPRAVPFVRVLAQRETATTVTAVEIAGRRYALRPGWNTLRLNLRRVGGLRVRIIGLRGPRPSDRGPGALAEVRVPGLRVTERLRPPTRTEDALRGQGARLRGTAVGYLLERARGDDPMRRSVRPDPDRALVPGSGESALVAEPDDGEARIRRTLTIPFARTFQADGWATVAPGTPDPVIDRWAGIRGGGRYSSSDRYQNLPARRASSAFDGSRAMQWVGAGLGAARPWIAWSGPRVVTLRRLRLVPGDLRAGRATRVTVQGGGRSSGPVRVARDGSVVLPLALRSRAFRLRVLAIGPAPGAVAVRARSVAISEIEYPGAPRAQPRHSGALNPRCGIARVRVASRVLRMAVRGSVGAMDRGEALRLVPCGARARLASGPARLDLADTPLRPDVLRVRSPAPALPAASPGVVRRPGTDGRGQRKEVEVALSRPARLVLGESYNAGWHARCDGDDLGPPTVASGYANGWRAPATCRSVEFAYGPNSPAHLSYGIGGLAMLVLLAILILGARRTRAGERWDPVPVAASVAAARLPARTAVVVGLLCLPVASLLFSVRAGVPASVGVGLLLWRGVSVRVLAGTAAGLIGVVVPALYLLFPPPDRGGFNGRYAVNILSAHWVTVAVWLLLAVACWRAFSTARGRRGDPAPAPPALGAGRSRS